MWPQSTGRPSRLVKVHGRCQSRNRIAGRGEQRCRRRRRQRRPPLRRAGEAISAVTVAGTFNEWDVKADKMKGPDADGDCTGTLDLPPGEYEYKFVLNGAEYHADPGNRRMAGFYGNSVLDVH
jgi:hypothetical protein